MLLIVCRLILDKCYNKVKYKKEYKMADIRKLLGLKIKEIRQKRRMSQEELSFESELHRTYISDIERGNRNVSIKNIEKIARALKVSIKELMP